MAVGVAPPIGMFPIHSGKGCCLLGLGDCLGIGVGGAAMDGSSSTGGVLGGGMGGGNGVLAPVGDDIR